MVWIALFDSKSSFLGYVQLHALPVSSPGDYRCMPHGILSFESAVVIGNDLYQGNISGWVEGRQWYRQATNRGGSLSTGV
jgi:hypothetical protein